MLGFAGFKGSADVRAKGDIVQTGKPNTIGKIVIGWNRLSGDLASMAEEQQKGERTHHRPS